MYSKDSKHRSDSLDEASQFSDLEDQIGTSPAHKPHVDKDLEPSVTKTEIKTVTTTISDRKGARDQTLEFIKYESEHSSQVLESALVPRDAEKVILLDFKYLCVAIETLLYLEDIITFLKSLIIF